MTSRLSRALAQPDTLPRQAELLELGKCAEFKQLSDQLTAGR